MEKTTFLKGFKNHRAEQARQSSDLVTQDQTLTNQSF